MRRDPRMYLFDIVSAADAITKFVIGQTQDGYFENDLVRSAVERKFEIIGEAVNQLAKIAPEIAERISQWRNAVAFRNVLAHAYMTVDHEIVWRTAMSSLPELRASAERVLKELSGPEP